MIREYTTENGFRIVADVMPHRKAVGASIWVKGGHRSEEENFGISHFLEHCVFLGSGRFPSSRELAYPVEKVGGGLGGESSYEFTVYSVKLPMQHIGLGLDIILDMVFFPRLDPERVDLERNVIYSEIDLYRDENYCFVNTHLLQRLVWGRHPLGRSGLGTKGSVRDISVASLRDFKETYYTPGNIIISIAGNVDFEETCEAIEEKVGAIVGKAPPPWKRYSGRQKAPRFRYYQKDTHQAFLCFGFRGPSYMSEKIYAQRLFNMFLGEGMSSLLFEEIRNRRGLAYDIHSNVRLYHDSGALVIYAEVNPQQASYTIDVVREVIEKLKSDGLSETELEEVKQQYIGALQMKLENLAFTADWTATNLLLRGERVSFESVKEKVEAVTREDIGALVGEIFSPKGTNLVVLGPRKIDVSL